MTKEGNHHDGLLAEEIIIGSISPMQKILFARHLAVMLHAGMSIADALKLIHHSSRGLFKKIVAEIYSGVKSGRSLASVLGRYPQIFSGFFRGAVLAGESSGNLALNLQNVAEQLKKDKELKDKLRSALFYPCLVVVTACLIGVFVAFYILPKIVPLLKALRVDLPWTTRALIAIAELLKLAGGQILIGLVIIVLGIFYLTKNRSSRTWLDGWWLAWPIIGGLVKAVNLSRFNRSLAVLLKSAVPINEALKLSAQALDNEAYRQVLLKIEKSVVKGVQLSTNLQRYPDYFPEIAVRMIKVGEESGSLKEALFDVAEFYEAELAQESKSLSTALEPILLIVIGLIVGLVAIAIITPIYSITGGIIR